MTEEKLKDILQKHKLWTEGNKEDGEKANLSFIDMCGTNLLGANLRFADFSHANLSDTDLTGADLRFADLRGANMCKANMCDTDLSGADLRWADLTGAKMKQKTMNKAYLSQKQRDSIFIINKD